MRPLLQLNVDNVYFQGNHPNAQKTPVSNTFNRTPENQTPGGHVMDIVKELVASQKDTCIQIRRDLHLIPEPAFTEEKTSAYVAQYLKKEGLLTQTGIAEYVVVGLLETGKPGKTLMIRSDMDALPIKEETGLEFASGHEGAMHACGHDAHMAMALSEDREPADGPPETGGGDCRSICSRQRLQCHSR
jgi:hypothetical protein